MIQPSPETHELPKIDPEVLAALHDSHIANPKDFARVVTEFTHFDSRFALGIFKEGHERGHGDHDYEEAFAEGALFAAEAIKRTLQLQQISRTEDSVSPKPMLDTLESPIKRHWFGRINRIGIAFASLASLRRTSQKGQLEI